MNQKEFLETVLPFKNKVFRLAKRLLVSTDEAEDATQELYLKLWNNKRKIKDYKNCGGLCHDDDQKLLPRSAQIKKELQI